MDRQPLSPAIPIFAQRPMNKVALVAEMEAMYRLDKDFYSLTLTWLQLLLSARSTNIRNQHRVPDVTPSPGVTS